MWSDSDAGFAATIAQEPFPPTGDTVTTIGHIGRYALKSRIGAGGLGTVYAAHDPLLSRPIAIKTLNLEISADEREAFNALFLNEARAAGGLSHPHIVTVFDAGISNHGGDNSAYIAMELLKGRDLRQLREEGWRPTPAQAALITRRVADALAYAHSKGVVHRDIKPANIFMVGRTQPRVLDFGIARVAHQHDGSAAGDIAAGSPYYMAPEQARMQPTDRRADVFSLGVVLYELLADAKPFRGNSLQEITTAVLEHEPPLASEVDPRVPKALADIAAQAMAKDPEHRYRSARAFARELRHWLEENVDADGGAATALPHDGPPSSRRFAFFAAAAVVMAAGLWLAWSSQRTAPPAEAAAVAAPQGGPAAAVPAVVVPAVSVAAAATAQVSAPAPAPATPAAALAVTPPALAEAPREAPKAATPAAQPENTKVAVTQPPKEAPKAAPKAASGETAKALVTETAKARRARERDVRLALAKPAASKPAAALATGVVRIAVSPWGQVEVDGAPAGTTPPLNELTLPEGPHKITLRNEDFPAHTTTVNVVAGQPVSVKHKFGS